MVEHEAAFLGSAGEIDVAVSAVAEVEVAEAGDTTHSEMVVEQAERIYERRVVQPHYYYTQAPALQ